MYSLSSSVVRLIFGNVEQDVMDNSQIYFLITALSFPFIGLFDANAAFFRAEGNSRLPMTISALCNLVNIAGNAVLIFGFHMGVAGAAISTLASRILMSIIMICRQRVPKQEIVIRDYFSIRPDMKLILIILSVGIRPVLKWICSSLVNWQSSPQCPHLELPPLQHRP